MLQYRDFIKNELGRRCAKNSNYSLRSFARDLGLSPSMLSEVLNRKHGLSSRVAAKVALKLNLSPAEKATFQELVLSENAKTETIRKLANKQLNQIKKKQGTLTEDVIKITTDWYHYVILEMLALEDVEHQSEWFAKRLGITVATAKGALERLMRVGLLSVENKQYQVTESFSGTVGGMPSASIRTYHKQVLEKSIQAIESQSIDERNLSSMVMAIDVKDLPAMADKIKNFRRKLLTEYGKTKNAKEVYAFNAQLIRLTEKKS